MSPFLAVRCLPLLIVVSAAAPISTPIGANADPVDEYVRLEMAKRHVPGAALAVMRDGKSIKLRGYGFANLELQTPVTPDTVFELASVTKQFTAAGILMLAQDGKLRLDDTLGKYLKDAPDTMSSITLKQLLSHTSGLPREGPLGSGRSYRDDISEDEIWRTARRLKPEFEPGERYSYSNLGFNLLGLVIEKVSGTSFADFMKSRVFAPLDMKSTRVNDLRTVIPNRAAGYYWQNDSYVNGEPTSPTTYSASGSIVSTAADLEKWDIALSSDGLLSAKSRDLMWTQTVLNDGKTTHYGFGWVVGDYKGHHCVFHDGLLSGFRSYIIRFTEDKLTVILLTNESSLDDPAIIAKGIARHYLPALKQDQPAAVAGTPAQFPSFTGRYEYGNNEMMTVTLTVPDGQIGAHLTTDAPDTYKPISESSFYSYDEDIQLSFVKDKSGAIVAVTVKQEGRERTAPRIGPLIHSMPVHPDPDPAFTNRVKTQLEALGKGGRLLGRTAGVTRGARKDFMTGVPDLLNIKSLTYIGSNDVSDRKIERHGGKVARVNYYKLTAGAATKYLLVYITADKLLTDEDIVDD